MKSNLMVEVTREDGSKFICHPKKMVFDPPLKQNESFHTRFIVPEKPAVKVKS